MRRAAVLFSIAVLGAAVGGCQKPQGSAAEARTVTVTGVGEAEAPPDQAQVSAGVQTFADSVAAASAANESAVARVMQALADQGIDKKNIGTTNYSIWAEQNYDKPEEQRVTGYHVSNIVVVTIDDIADVGDVLAAVTNAGANAVHGIQFSVADTDALETRAREQAMQDARHRAESLAKLAGVKLGDVLTLSTNAGPTLYEGPAMARQAMQMSEAPVPTITPGQQSVSVQVQVTYEIR